MMVHRKRFLLPLETFQVYCSKPGCSNTWLNRHHIRHEKMWFYLPVKWKKELEELKQEYDMFIHSQIGIICLEHHGEIHALYDVEIVKFKDRYKKNLSKFTYKQAKRLMTKLETIYHVWIKKVTPGLPVGMLDVMRGRKSLPAFLELDEVENVKLS